jgi:histidine triad (HIT) family protein
MNDCIFCKIIAGEIPGAKIYEDDKALAFLDINYVNPGHVLIIPKEHYENMVETPNELVAYLYVKAKELMIKIKKAMEADYVCLSVVGTDVPHFHIHLIPRWHDDGLAGFWPTKKYSEGEMEKIAEKIKEEI